MGVKTCPRCGQELFEDMDVCYGCLYDFRRDGGRGEAFSDAVSSTNRVRIGGDFRPADDPLASVELDEIDDEERPTRGRHRRDREGDTLDADSTLGLALATRSPAAAFSVLVVASGVRVRVPLPPEGLTIGRDGSNDVVLSSRSVSRRHVRLTPQKGMVVAEDQGATNPALVHGVPLEGSVSLGPGETFEVCGTSFAIEAAEG